ncbi:MAG: hypothetical protein M3433_04835 [Actinomycetota bacterium]|nr:hypothetical protein [Actinomycetota bacterium]
MSRRRILVAAAAAVVLAVALVLLVAEGDESVVREPATTVGSSPAQGTTPSDTAGPGEPESSTKERQPPPEILTHGPRRDVSRAVSDLIQAVELGDGEAFCALVGRRSGDAEGIEALRACGRQARIDPFTLPTSDELTVREVEVKGASSVARLGGGETVTLEREGGRWRVRSFAR